MGMDYQQIRQLQEMLRARQFMQQSAHNPAFQDPSQDPSQAMTGGHPLAGQADQMQSQLPSSFEQVQQNAQNAVDPMTILPDVIAQIMNWTLGIVQDHTLDKPVQSAIIQQQSDAIATLMKVITDSQANQADPAQQAQQQAEMEMKQQAHTQDMAMQHEKHQTELQMAQEKHAMEMQKAQADMAMQQQKAQNDQHVANQKINQQEDTHQQKLVHNEEANKAKIQQQKQAAQQKQSSNSGSNKGKKNKKK